MQVLYTIILVKNTIDVVCQINIHITSITTCFLKACRTVKIFT